MSIAPRSGGESVKSVINHTNTTASTGPSSNPITPDPDSESKNTEHLPPAGPTTAQQRNRLRLTVYQNIADEANEE